MSYAKLVDHFRRIGHLREVEAIVEWDEAVNLPDSAAPSRTDAMATLSVMWHELLASPELEDWLAAAEQQSELDGWERANLREMRRLHTRACAVPLDLVEAAAKAEKTSEHAWRRYRAENDYESYRPYLEQVVERKREVATELARAFGVSPYDALLADFEPGACATDIDAVFAPLRAFLPEFILQVEEQQRHDTVAIPEGPFPRARQMQLGVQLMQAVGFDSSRGRLDESHHAFCGGVPGDVRITTRYDEADFSSALMGVLHEAGHGKYEQGLPTDWQHQPVGLARGMVLHESQSLLLEMQICRGREFLTFAAPQFRAAFPEAVLRRPAAFDVDNLATWYTRVERSFIRVDADEVTYPAHILLRYDLERALVSGDLAVRDLPEAWDAQMRQLLGLSTAGNFKAGCLQDIHWPSGLFGYFPLYTLGAMAAAQLFAALLKAEPLSLRAVERGDFAPINGWLGRHVWSLASSQSTDEILKQATGEGLNPSFFQRHLERRYLT